MITDSEQIEEARMLREVFLIRLTGRHLPPDNAGYWHLAKIINHAHPVCNFYSSPVDDGLSPIVGITEESFEWLKMLNGPNGEAVYRMLCARHGEPPILTEKNSLASEGDLCHKK